jgi:hypothetical protein
MTLMAPTPAYACNVEPDKHCYSIVDWSMTKPEEVMGAYDEIETSYGDVPHFEMEFIDNEMWVAFPQINDEAWVEAGVTFGYGTGSEDVDDYFYAGSYGPKKYKEFIYPEGPPNETWIGVYLDDPEINGAWCVEWKWDTKPEICWTGFSDSSIELESGLEFATTTASGADDNGRNSGWAQYMNGGWHHEWNDGVTKAEPIRNKPLCIAAPAPGYTWGSIAYSAPGC